MNNKQTGVAIAEHNKAGDVVSCEHEGCELPYEYRINDFLSRTNVRTGTKELFPYGPEHLLCEKHFRCSVIRRGHPLHKACDGTNYDKDQRIAFKFAGKGKKKYKGKRRDYGSHNAR